MVKIKYIGQTTNLVGKTLWEIVGNLQNLGVGRLVTRGMFLRYPEPSFFKIVKVITENQSVEPLFARRVIAWCEVVFRGRRIPNLRELQSNTYKPDYQLIPREEEGIYYKRLSECQPEQKIFYPFVDAPPLLKLLMIEEMKKKRERVNEDPKLPILFAKSDSETHRVATEGETPTHFCESGFGTPVNPALVANIDECRDLFVNQDPWNDTSTIKKIKWND